MYQRIRGLREDKDMTQAEMSAELHCGVRAYGYYESGERDIPTEILVKLAEYHNTSIDYLLNLTDVPKPYKRKGK